MSAAGRTIILDAGTGLRQLGAKLVKEGAKDATLLLTHVHWDHICGFPFFGPAFKADFDLAVMAALPGQVGGIRSVLGRQMTEPLFPVPLEQLHARIDFQDFEAGLAFEVGADIKVRTAPLNHPNAATGYRIEHAGRALCYVTDTEHVPGNPDQRVLELIDGADLVIYDCTYTDEEFPAHVGWGHSTWQEGVRLCKQAGARRLAIFHHDPDHEDDFMARVEQEASAMWDGAFVAREGMTIWLD